ncbi:TetR/AcrR family transcriptional regulator [Paenibacillus aurantiacus]|uniref:TetR/AcrR family transcriptional regulator n=1 Tax=Paenibacillus aurantiacus TaxID=1936118 RepID=A0ABV5L0M2_9BACL
MSNRMDPRVVRTRRLLRNALFDLLKERDIQQVTIRDIAERAKVKRPTFYLHYTDKDAFVLQCISDILDELRVAVGFDPPFAHDFAASEPHPVFVRMFRHIADHYPIYSALLVRNRIPAFAEGLLAVLHEFVQSGIDKTEPDDANLTANREVIVKFVESAFLEVIVWWVEKGMPYSEENIAAQLMNLSLHGPYKRNPIRLERRGSDS